MEEEFYYQSLVLDAVDSATTFSDVGAHIGVHAFLSCERARRVMAFEPGPYNLSALKQKVLEVGAAISSSGRKPLSTEVVVTS